MEIVNAIRDLIELGRQLVYVSLECSIIQFEMLELVDLILSPE